MATDSGYNVITVTGGQTGALQAGLYTISTNGTDHFTLGDGAAAETFRAHSTSLPSTYTYLGLASTVGTTGFYASKSGVTYYFTKQAINPGAAISLTPDTLGAGGADYTFCFMPGTLIRTLAGETAVESLAMGDLVLTITGDPPDPLDRPADRLGGLRRPDHQAAGPHQGRRPGRQRAEPRPAGLARPCPADRRRADPGRRPGQRQQHHP
jgi:hypothetical protein